MKENRVGLGEGKSWRMPTEGGEKSKFDISNMFYLGDCTQQWKGGPCVQMGGSVLRRHLASVHRVEWESRGREVFHTVDGENGVHLGSAETPKQRFSKFIMHEQRRSTC